MFKNRSVNVHSFAMVPRADIPRSSFRMQRAYKTTFGGGPAEGGTPVEEYPQYSWLYPIFCEEVLPGDTFNLRMTAFARLATPINPTMDNLYLDSFFFFVPNRLTWENWPKFMGERYPFTNSSIDYTVPQQESPTGGYLHNSLGDYFGLPIAGQIDGDQILSHNALPFRAYKLIWNEWFRDQNVDDAVEVPLDDGPDATLPLLLPRFKRHDYFTSCLPWPQKGDAVTLPIGGNVPVYTSEEDNPLLSMSMEPLHWQNPAGSSPTLGQQLGIDTGGVTGVGGSGFVPLDTLWPSNLYADLSEITSVTINQLRQSFQIQKLLERDARGGTRYTEVIRAHFGVISPDARLQRPEYLGGGSTPVQISPVAQTSATTVTGTDTPQGNLAAIGTSVFRNHGFTQSFTEHGYVIGLVNIRADLSYQQGLRRHWSRQTRYDYYFPVFAMLGEQAVLRKEIYCTGDPANDDVVFGYQERWAEYRYMPSEITGYFRSTTSGTLDSWHYAQNFETPPVLNAAFMRDQPPLERNLAVGPEANGAQFLFDAFFDIQAARALPMYSVPGLIDHF